MEPFNFITTHLSWPWLLWYTIIGTFSPLGFRRDQSLLFAVLGKYLPLQIYLGTFAFLYNFRGYLSLLQSTPRTVVLHWFTWEPSHYMFWILSTLSFAWLKWDRSPLRCWSLETSPSCWVLNTFTLLLHNWTSSSLNGLFFRTSVPHSVECGFYITTSEHCLL